MRWFRSAALISTSIVVLMAVIFSAVILATLTNTTYKKSMEYDPVYNGTLVYYILILIVQVCFISSSFLGYYVAFINWRNNYQMDHGVRSKFMAWMFMWAIFSLMDLSIAIFAIIRGKEPQEEMATLYEVFTKYNQDIKFVGQFERYQRENSCCGIFGPDDWFLVQMRNGAGGGGGGGGGGGFHNMDYGYRQNPSTGQCHLTPPTIPMGCGRRILEGIHVQLATYAGLMLLQTVVGFAAAAFAAYAFFYWLEKEVIVIPEDEVSNLIVLEPESSTSFEGSGGGYLGSGYYGSAGGGYPPMGSGYLGSAEGSYLQGSSVASSSMGGSSSNRGGSGSSGGKGAGSGSGSGGRPSGSKNKSKSASASKKSTGVQAQVADPIPKGYEPKGSERAPLVGQEGMQEGMLSMEFQGSGGSMKGPSQGQGSRAAAASSKSRGAPRSKNHFLHEQERALGGKVLGEIHVDHRRAEYSRRELGQGQGSHGHHATIAIVKNRNPPARKKYFPETASSGRHSRGQSGHLDSDTDIASRRRIDDIFPGRRGYSSFPQEEDERYLRALHRRQWEQEKRAKDRPLSTELQAQGLLSEYVYPFQQRHRQQQYYQQFPVIVPYDYGHGHGQRAQRSHSRAQSIREEEYIRPSQAQYVGSRGPNDHFSAQSHSQAHAQYLRSRRNIEGANYINGELRVHRHENRQQDYERARRPPQDNPSRAPSSNPSHDHRGRSRPHPHPHSHHNSHSRGQDYNQSHDPSQNLLNLREIERSFSRPSPSGVRTPGPSNRGSSQSQQQGIFQKWTKSTKTVILYKNPNNEWDGEGRDRA